MTLQRSGCTV